MKSAVACLTRNCEKYIQEWIFFYHLQGFDAIIVGLHRCEDNTLKEIEKLPLKVLSKVIVDTETENKWNFQRSWYPAIAKKYCKDVEWLAMFDDDEYFYDSQNRPINELLATVNEAVGQIVVPWVTFGHCGRVESITKQETRLAAFTKRLECHQQQARGNHAKVFVRVSKLLDVDDDAIGLPGSQWYGCHYARVSGRSVDFSGNDLYEDIDWTKTAHRDVYSRLGNVLSSAQCLAHYYTGAMEDWVARYKNWKSWQTEFSKQKINLRKRLVEHFLNHAGDIVDTRMLSYVPDLQNLLLEDKYDG